MNRHFGLWFVNRNFGLWFVNIHFGIRFLNRHFGLWFVNRHFGLWFVNIHFGLWFLNRHFGLWFVNRHFGFRAVWCIIVVRTLFTERNTRTYFSIETLSYRYAFVCCYRDNAEFFKCKVTLTYLNFVFWKLSRSEAAGSKMFMMTR